MLGKAVELDLLEALMPDVGGVSQLRADMPVDWACVLGPMWVDCCVITG